MRRHTVVIAEDNAHLRRALVLLIDGLEDFRVIGAASVRDEVVPMVRRHRPDLLVLDTLNHELELIRAVRRRCPRTRVVVYTGHEDPDRAQRMLSAGAAAHVVKSGLLDDLVDELRRVMEKR